MDKIQTALNSNTIFDIYEGNEKTGAVYSSTQFISSASAKKHTVDVPVYKATHDLGIQAGANSDQLIHVTYDSLRVLNLGLGTTSVLTGKTATKAIAEVQEAERIIAEQQSLFGAYQNRFEHASMVNANTAENLQMTESKIRDIDMADEMVRLSVANILSQAGQAMLSQANGMTQGVLQLLNMK